MKVLGYSGEMVKQ